MPYIMSLDQGTSSTRAVIYSLDGQVIAVAQHMLDLLHPADGWVEQDPEAIWQTTLKAGREVIGQAAIDPADIACIGITNQRETSLMWDRESSACVYNAIVWQDRRTAGLCADMRADSLNGQPLEAALVERTGLVIDPYFSSTKVAWMAQNIEGVQEAARRGDLAFGTVDSFLIWRLTLGCSHVTDATNASRTQLFDIRQQRWSEELLAYFDIPINVLPRVCDSAGVFGVADSRWFGAEIPITGVAGDQQAALIGQGCLASGLTKSTYGTGCFVMANTGQNMILSSEKLLTTVAFRIGGRTTYALEGSIFTAGVAIKWLRDQLGLIETPADTQAAFDRTNGDAQGVFVVPAFTGLGAPHWQPDVRGLITGLSLSTNRDHLLTAFLQSVVFQTQALLAAMVKDGAVIDRLRIDGGMVTNEALCQFLADIIDVPVERPANIESTSLGAAMLAGVGHSIYPDLLSAWPSDQGHQEFSPQLEAHRRDDLVGGYQQAVAQVLANI